MGENLLRDGGFEEPWAGSHWALVAFPAGGYEMREIGSIFSLPDWLAWFAHDPGKWDQPEVRDIHSALDARRVRSGDKAAMMFGFSRKHWGGFLQQVEVEPGARLMFVAYAHAWSNHNDLPGHEESYDKPRWSSGFERDADIAIMEGETPPLTGDKWNDAQPNFSFRLGVDPTGGINPLGPDVFWGLGRHIYNHFHQVPPVEVTARSDRITVFLSSKTMWPFKHNDAYFDDALLYSVRGRPRVQYSRTYVLLPPDADARWAQAVVDARWDSDKWTIGGSADDAGIGDLDVRKVLAVNPHLWPDGLTVAWYDKHYPGVDFVIVNADTPEQLKAILGA